MLSTIPKTALTAHLASPIPGFQPFLVALMASTTIILARSSAGGISTSTVVLAYRGVIKLNS